MKCADFCQLHSSASVRILVHWILLGKVFVNALTELSTIFVMLVDRPKSLGE